MYGLERVDLNRPVLRSEYKPRRINTLTRELILFKPTPENVLLSTSRLGGSLAPVRRLGRDAGMFSRIKEDTELSI